MPIQRDFDYLIPENVDIHKDAQIKRHLAALGDRRNPVSNAWLSIFSGLVTMARNHETRYKSPIGDDYVLCVHYEYMLEGLKGLLSGEIGALDAGSCSAGINRLARDVGVVLPA